MIYRVYHLAVTPEMFGTNTPFVDCSTREYAEKLVAILNKIFGNLDWVYARLKK